MCGMLLTPFGLHYICVQLDCDGAHHYYVRADRDFKYKA